MGFGGKATLSGSFFKMGYAGYEFTVQELGIEFENSALKSGTVKGELALPIPFEGKVSTEVTISAENIVATVATDRPIVIPKMGISMTVLSGTQVEYVVAEKLGKMTINAFVITKSLGEIQVSGLEVSSDGTVKAKEITIEKAIQFAGGFDLHAQSVSFSKAADGFTFAVKGSFGFPKIPIQNISGEVSISSGPILDVKLTGARVEFDYTPVHFKGEFEWSGREFSGNFDIGIKKILDNGIKGMLIVGNLDGANGSTWNYWYAELTVGTKIPLGNTGLVLLGLGGGLGYNYIPPIGSTKGHPEQNDAFSFKAIVEMGTAPSGELFAGRMEMVLTPGRFTLYGKAWLINQRENIYGEGQLGLQWSPDARMDGYLAMMVGIPDAKGSVFVASGKINFLFAGTDQFYIRSETLKASLFQAINADASISVDQKMIQIDGKLYYKLNKSVPLAVATVKVKLDVSATAGLKYQYQTSTLNAGVAFSGVWDVDLETSYGTADITGGDIKLQATLTASPAGIDVKASANISYDLWIYKDSITLDMGYHST